MRRYTVVYVVGFWSESADGSGLLADDDFSPGLSRSSILAYSKRIIRCN